MNIFLDQALVLCHFLVRLCKAHKHSCSVRGKMCDMEKNERRKLIFVCELYELHFGIQANSQKLVYFTFFFFHLQVYIQQKRKPCRTIIPNKRCFCNQCRHRREGPILNFHVATLSQKLMSQIPVQIHSHFACSSFKEYM